MARDEGWLAEHMLILKLTSPEGVVKFIAAAFPSACGKTNLAMLRPTHPRAGRSRPSATTSPGCGSATTAGCGRSTPSSASSASRPAPTRRPTPTRWTPSTRATRSSPTSPSPRTATSGGRAWRTPPSAPPAGRASPGRRRATSCPATPTAATARRSSSATSSPPSTTTRAACPIDAILFGGRRKTTVPLVFEARDWTHGTFLGATLSSETTAAAVGAVGVVRRDPMAMLPFIGYNAGHYFNHWITVGKDNDAAKLPKIFYVNWFRRDEQGDFLWPGFGENSRVLKWVVERIEGTAAAVETPIGHVPTADGLDLEGLDMTPEAGRGRPRRRPRGVEAPSCPRSRSGSRSSATTCPPSSGPSSTASGRASAPEPTALPRRGPHPNQRVRPSSFCQSKDERNPRRAAKEAACGAATVPTSVRSSRRARPRCTRRPSTTAASPQSDPRLAPGGELRRRVRPAGRPSACCIHDQEASLHRPVDPSAVQSRVVAPMSQQGAELISESAQWARPSAPSPRPGGARRRPAAGPFTELQGRGHRRLHRPRWSPTPRASCSPPSRRPAATLPVLAIAARARHRRPRARASRCARSTSTRRAAARSRTSTSWP